MFLCIYFKDKSQGPSDAAAGPTQTSISRSGILNHFTDLQWGASVKDAGPPPPQNMSLQSLLRTHPTRMALNSGRLRRKLKGADSGL